MPFRHGTYIIRFLILVVRRYVLTILLYSIHNLSYHTVLVRLRSIYCFALNFWSSHVCTGIHVACCDTAASRTNLSCSLAGAHILQSRNAPITLSLLRSRSSKIILIARPESSYLNTITLAQLSLSVHSHLTWEDCAHRSTLTPSSSRCPVCSTF